MNAPLMAATSVVRFAWPVADEGYRWSREYQVLPGAVVPSSIKAAPDGPWLVDPASFASIPGRYTHPLRNRRDLHAEFAQLPLGASEADLAVLAAFASKHGLLGIGGYPLIGPAAADGSKKLSHGEHFAVWQRSIATMRVLVDLASAYGTRDVKCLREWVQWRGGGRGVEILYPWPERQHPWREWIVREAPTTNQADLDLLWRWSRATSDEERYLEPVRHYLFAKINELLPKHLDPYLPEDEGIVLRPDSLYGAMVVLLAEQLSGQWQMRRCPSCGRLFSPRVRRDQKTCSTVCRKRLSRKKEATP